MHLTNHKEFEVLESELQVIFVSDSMIMHIQDVKSPKQAWDTLMKMYNTNTQARKMQFKQELHNLQKNKMNINDYSTKVQNLANVLASIGAPIDDVGYDLEWTWKRL